MKKINKLFTMVVFSALTTIFLTACDDPIKTKGLEKSKILETNLKFISATYWGFNNHNNSLEYKQVFNGDYLLNDYSLNSSVANYKEDQCLGCTNIIIEFPTEQNIEDLKNLENYYLTTVPVVEYKKFLKGQIKKLEFKARNPYYTKDNTPYAVVYSNKVEVINSKKVRFRFTVRPNSTGKDVENIYFFSYKKFKDDKGNSIPAATLEFYLNVIG